MAKKQPFTYKAFNWLGMEANNRAILSLVALGTIVGGIVVFAVNRFGPLVSPSLSLTDYGEGYRRGKREAELEQKLRAAERSLYVIKSREQIEREVRQ